MLYVLCIYMPAIDRSLSDCRYERGWITVRPQPAPAPAPVTVPQPEARSLTFAGNAWADAASVDMKHREMQYNMAVRVDLEVPDEGLDLSDLSLGDIGDDWLEPRVLERADRGFNLSLQTGQTAGVLLKQRQVAKVQMRREERSGGD